MSDDKFSIDDNIVLDPKTAKTNNIKKILTGIAILVVLFLIILIIMKFINSGNIEEPKPLVMPSEEIIFKPKAKKPKEPIKEITKPSTAQENENLEPQVVEIRPVKIEKTQEAKKEVKPSVDEEKTKQEPKKAAVKEVDTQPKSKREVVVVTSKKEEVKKEQPKKVEKKAEPKKQEVKKQTTPKVEKKAEKKSASKPTQTSAKSTLQSGNYIQVLATAEFKPDADYIKKLKNKGYSYTLYKTKVKGKEYIKVLVGPFDEANLQSQMANIRATINKDAFVFRIK